MFVPRFTCTLGRNADSVSQLGVEFLVQWRQRFGFGDGGFKWDTSRGLGEGVEARPRLPFFAKQDLNAVPDIESRSPRLLDVFTNIVFDVGERLSILVTNADLSKVRDLSGLDKDCLAPLRVARVELRFHPDGVGAVAVECAPTASGLGKGLGSKHFGMCVCVLLSGLELKYLFTRKAFQFFIFTPISAFTIYFFFDFFSLCVFSFFPFDFFYLPCVFSSFF